MKYEELYAQHIEQVKKMLVDKSILNEGLIKYLESLIIMDKDELIHRLRVGILVDVSYFKTGLDLRPSLRDLNIPTLIIYGKQDRAPASMYEDMRASMQNCKLLELDCGHNPFTENPEELFSEIREFLKKSEERIA